ncbi:hypothetical protein [Sphingobacterium sp. UDSM-2020]|uniref:hypothetical protein n=1 Tax=Sphingobacterium sp. UDSM-2020 TaxID=2795738 RepID=UPI0019359A7B|nr:hypothetical protein [Sphingobacterium sp. UDSM-2020]QQD14257.1 hypothetical protein JAZ75_01540 [Sphingobacterium sp. UDSM-2020]
MNKEDFTPMGVQKKLVAFYAQDELTRQVQIDYLQKDFRAAIKASFYLAPDQEEWFDMLDDTFIFVLSRQLAVTLTLELPVHLVKPEKPASGTTVLGVKRGDSHNPIYTSAGAGEKPLAEGEFIFTITY